MKLRGLVLAASVAGLAGCGGGAALLHGAHVLPEGTVSMGAGASGTFVVGDASKAIADARATTAPGIASVPGNDATYTRGALAVAALGPGVAPWVGSRIGLLGDNEAGITYSGRTARIDARHAFQSESFALSTGAGASAVLSHRGSGSSGDLGGLDLDGTSGWGIDVPLLAGWRSQSGIVSLWAGPRGGYEKLGGTLGLVLPSGAGAPAGSATTTGDVSVERIYYGGVVGLSVGFRHVHGALELDAYGQRVAGTLAGIDAKATGLCLSPAAALIATF